jgi:hypothetical protein
MKEEKHLSPQEHLLINTTVIYEGDGLQIFTPSGGFFANWQGMNLQK